MMIKWPFLIILVLMLAACGQQTSDVQNSKVKVGMVLADYGLGDQSFNDTAFLGLIKARNELGILFDYRDLLSSGSYQQAFHELIEEDCDLIIAIGFNLINEVEMIAKEFPEQRFLYIDGILDLPNVTSITFREDEGSFIVGLIAGLKTDTNTLGFIGGMDVPLITKFKDGFTAGVHAVNPEAKVIVDYTNSFGDTELARELARQMIEEHQADILYPAAGLAGLGALEEAASQNVFAIGVDSDQFYVAERAIITSMLKNMDVAVYTAIQRLVEQGELTEGDMVLGIKENGVGAAPVRVISLSQEELEIIDSFTNKLVNGDIEIN